MKLALITLLVSSVSAIDTVPVGTYDRCDLAGGFPYFYPKSCPSTDCCSSAASGVQRCIPYYQINSNSNLDPTTSVLIPLWHKEGAGTTFSGSCPTWVKGAERLVAGVMAAGAAAYLSIWDKG